MLRVRAVCGTLLALGLCARVASARPASTGFFAEGGLGMVGFVGSPASSDVALGPSIDMRVGRDVFSWLSLGGVVAASTHRATLPPPPTDQYFQLYRAGVEARLRARFDAVAVFAEGGIGASMVSSNVLDKAGITKPGKSFSATLNVGVGVQYQLLNRHYAVGVAVDGFMEPQFASVKAIDGRVFLRYTYGGGGGG